MWFLFSAAVAGAWMAGGIPGWKERTHTSQLRRVPQLTLLEGGSTPTAFFICRPHVRILHHSTLTDPISMVIITSWRPLIHLVYLFIDSSLPSFILILTKLELLNTSLYKPPSAAVSRVRDVFTVGLEWVLSFPLWWYWNQWCFLV